ncbi:flagellar basal body rod protein FlgB [Hirschia baltica]|uniref:Flagellar basal body rod protein FlgB n=1 Tax=Hirschia baltica (strain ATCC 49814 / DSM 5838 / IFAM 1418) TaxID=582402 RepID=C6XNK1_HIRBI|nr:flagellar basal-body rod protein FlgB [Hirschia baltica]ACT58254.1 flagellar basal-body rod protein FlgB [Hirschia baltica ATCC 49814]
MTGPMNMPIFGMMKARMDMLGERQKVLSQNVSNVSTPGYTPKDVDISSFNAALAKGKVGNNAGAGGPANAGAMAVTHPGHIAASASRGSLVAGAYIEKAPDSETTLDGNGVVVEDQMMKIAETRMEFETMIGLYNKSLSMMRLAAKAPR